MSNTQKETRTTQSGCVIWMHGLGADSSDMSGLAMHPRLSSLGLQHIFLDAPLRPVTFNAGLHMQAWYDIYSLTRIDKEDKQGILESEAEITAVIDKQIAAGFLPQQIILAGFSQGGAIALYTALHSKRPLGGVISLSAYLPLAMECQAVVDKKTPFFIGFGQFDTVVVPELTKRTEQWLMQSGYSNITMKSYTMEHSICNEEINDIAHWLSAHLKGESSV